MIPPILARSRGLRRLYGLLFAPLLEEYGLTQLEADILMFLANNPQWDTARDIVEFRYLAKSHVSAGIKRLAARGYLERFTLPGNRKVIHLRLLPPSGPVVERGRELQDKYGRLLLDGLTEKEIALLQRLLDRIAENTDRAIALRERN